VRRILRAITECHVAKSEAGVTAIEYGLIAALIALAIMASVTLFAGKMSAMLTTIAGKL
jgi:pilus assembly protein Flp/PilA